MWDLRRGVERNGKDLALAGLYGTALMHGPDVQIEGATGVTNRATFHLSNAERDGARLLARAAADPRFPLAATELAEVALATRHAATVKIARSTLKSLGDRGTAAHWRFAAELALVDKDYAGARAAGERALALGDNAAHHAVGIARLMTTPDTAAASTYLAGLADSTAVTMYYDDISYLLQPADTLAWQNVAAPERAAWIRKQWDWRASTASLSLPERLALHFKRVTSAWALYPRTVFRASPATNAILFDPRQRRMTLDDRGLIYVRHGAPAEVIPMGSSSLDDTRIAWGYNGLGGGRAIFEFTKKDCPVMMVAPRPVAERTGGGGRSARRGGTAPPPAVQTTTKCVNSGDFYLSSPVPCQLVSPQVAQATYYDYGTSLAKYDPAYATHMVECYTLAMQGNADDMAFQSLGDAELRRESQTAGMAALRTETAGPPLTSPITTIVRSYAMRAGDATQLFAFAAVDGGSVAPKAGTAEYALRMLLSVEHNGALKTESVDTTLRFATQAPMQAGQYARPGLATIASPAADVTVRFSVRNENDASQGQITTTSRAIPDFAGNRFALSDLVIAEPRNGTWTRGMHRLAPAPGHYVEAGTTFRLYHEIYGAQDGDSLSVQITIAPGSGESILSQIGSLINRRQAVQIGFSEPAAVDASGTGRVMREIGADLEPGRYVVTVSVRNGRTNATADARTEMVVLKP